MMTEPLSDTASKTEALERFGLQREPFAGPPDMSRHVHVSSQAEVLDELSTSVRRGSGLVVLTGAAGLGKTQTCRALSERLEPPFRVVILPGGTIPTRRGLLHVLLHALQVDASGTAEHEARLRLLDELGRRAGNGERLVVVADEAESLSRHLLEELRALTNFVTHGEPLIRVVLCGSVAFEERLADTDYDTINQRISFQASLQPLTAQESAEYVAGCLAVAGGAVDVLFTGAGLSNLCHAAAGSPRAINALASAALDIAATSDSGRIDEAAVEAAYAEVRGLPLSFETPPSVVAYELETAAASTVPDLEPLGGEFVEVGRNTDEYGVDLQRMQNVFEGGNPRPDTVNATFASEANEAETRLSETGESTASDGLRPSNPDEEATELASDVMEFTDLGGLVNQSPAAEETVADDPLDHGPTEDDVVDSAIEASFTEAETARRQDPAVDSAWELTDEPAPAGDGTPAETCGVLSVLPMAEEVARGVEEPTATESVADEAEVEETAIDETVVAIEETSPSLTGAEVDDEPAGGDVPAPQPEVQEYLVSEDVVSEFADLTASLDSDSDQEIEVEVAADEKTSCEYADVEGPQTLEIEAAAADWTELDGWREAFVQDHAAQPIAEVFDHQDALSSEMDLPVVAAAAPASETPEVDANDVAAVETHEEWQEEPTADDVAALAAWIDVPPDESTSYEEVGPVEYDVIIPGGEPIAFEPRSQSGPEDLIPVIASEVASATDAESDEMGFEDVPGADQTIPFAVPTNETTLAVAEFPAITDEALGDERLAAELPVDQAVEELEAVVEAEIAQDGLESDGQRLSESTAADVSILAVEKEPCDFVGECVGVTETDATALNDPASRSASFRGLFRRLRARGA